jgi:predicted deacetylase
VHESRVDTLSAALARTRIADGVPVPDFSPPAYRMRKAIFRRLPRRAITWLAVLRHKIPIGDRPL